MRAAGLIAMSLLAVTASVLTSCEDDDEERSRKLDGRPPTICCLDAREAATDDPTPDAGANAADAADAADAPAD